GDPVVNDGYVSYATYMDPHGLNIDTQRRYSPVAIPPITTLNQRGISATVDWQISDRLALKSITAVREYQSTFAQDVDGSPVNSQLLLQHLDHEQKSQELRLSGTAANDRLDYTGGTSLFKPEGTLEANVNLYYVQLNFIHGPDPTPSHNSSACAHMSYALTDRLNLSLGLRYSDDEKTYVHFRRNPDGTLPQDATPDDPNTTCIGPPHNVINPSNCALFGLYNEGATWEDTR